MLCVFTERAIKSKDWPSTHKPSVATPENGVKVKLQFNKPIQAEIVGKAATELLNSLDQQNKSNATLPSSSIIVTEEFSSRVLIPSDLSLFTPCRTGCVENRAVIPMPVGFALRELSLEHLRSCIKEVFDDVCVVAMNRDAPSSSSRDSDNYLLVEHLVAVHPSSCPPTDMVIGNSAASNGSIIVQWQGGPDADIIADG